MPAHFRKALLAVVLPGFALHASAAAATPTYLAYYLPKARIGASVSQRLVRCPRNEQDGQIEVETTWTLSARAVPDYSRPVTIDASSGFLAARTVGMKFNPDGTLTSLNASSTGQGGAVLASVIKLAGTFAPILAGVPAFNANPSQVIRGPKPRSPCKDEIVELLDRHSALAGKIDEIETAIVGGQSSTEQRDLLALYREQLLAIEERLTLTSSATTLNDAVSGLRPCEVGTECKPEGTASVASLPYGTWFEDWFLNAGGAKEIPGSGYGFVVSWAGSSAAASSVVTLPGKAPLNDRQQELVYLRPVPAVLVAAPCKNALCEPDERPEAASASGALEFVLPQLSPRFALPVGSAGIFGSREVAASFDSWGRPTELSYGSDPGGEAIAGAIDAVGEAATGIHNAGLDAMNHAIALQEARDKLKSFKPTTPPQPGAQGGQS